MARMLTHEILQDISRVASEIGKNPSRDEYRKQGRFSTKKISQVFGTWTIALQNIGAKPEKEKSPKIKAKEFFQRDVQDFLKKGQPQQPQFSLYPKIVCLGDLHCPWWAESKMSLAYWFIERLQPEFIFQMGDGFDFYAQAKFPKSQMTFSPDQELHIARTQQEMNWETVHKIVPKAKKIQLKGNHDIRPHKRVIEKCPELEPFFDFEKFFEFPNVHTVKDPREPFIIQDIAFIHGFTQNGRHRAHLPGYNVVHGHTHRGGVIHDMVIIDGKPTQSWKWELDCGYLGDPSQKCFNYTPLKETKWRHGIGIITELGPVFIDFED